MENFPRGTKFNLEAWGHDLDLHPRKSQLGEGMGLAQTQTQPKKLVGAMVGGRPCEDIINVDRHTSLFSTTSNRIVRIPSKPNIQ